MDKRLLAIIGVIILGVVIYLATRKKAGGGIDLVAGLNSGIVYGGATKPVAEGVSSITPYLTAIWWQDADGAWHAYQPGAPEWGNDLLTVVQGNTYNVNVTQACRWSW